VRFVEKAICLYTHNGKFCAEYKAHQDVHEKHE